MQIYQQSLQKTRYIRTHSGSFTIYFMLDSSAKSVCTSESTLYPWYVLIELQNIGIKCQCKQQIIPTACEISWHHLQRCISGALHNEKVRRKEGGRKNEGRKDIGGLKGKTWPCLEQGPQVPPPLPGWLRIEPGGRRGYPGMLPPTHVSRVLTFLYHICRLSMPAYNIPVPSTPLSPTNNSSFACWEGVHRVS